MELQIPLVSSNASHHINAVATVLNSNMFISIMRFAATSSATSVNTVQCRTFETQQQGILLYTLKNQLWKMSTRNWTVSPGTCVLRHQVTGAPVAWELYFSSYYMNRTQNGLKHNIFKWTFFSLCTILTVHLTYINPWYSNDPLLPSACNSKMNS